FIVKKVAMDHGLHATFMPKPIFGVNGSGMHTHQSFLDTRGNNVFYDPKAKYQLSKTALYYTGGILRHARSFVALTSPLVNSAERRAAARKTVGSARQLVEGRRRDRRPGRTYPVAFPRGQEERVGRVHLASAALGSVEVPGELLITWRIS